MTQQGAMFQLHQPDFLRQQTSRHKVTDSMNASAFAFLLLLTIASTCAFSYGSGKSFVAPRVNTRRSKQQLSMRWGLEGGSANKPSGNLPEGVYLRDTVPFEIRGFSLPLVVFSIGTILTASSFAGYFLNSGDGEGAISSLGFVYGIPIFLIGLSLWYAELPPVEVITSAAGDRAWEKHSTDTLRKIKQDVTRHRYGDDAHLDSTLESLGLKLPQKKYPKLLSLAQEETPEGQLDVTLTFESAETPYKIWADPARVARYGRFFGPGLLSEVIKVDKDKRIVAIKLTTQSQEQQAAAATTSTGGDAPVAAGTDSDDF